ncbi:MAG: hypothetical protein AB1782_14965 [Cyanobacteriota bacterium]
MRLTNVSEKASYNKISGFNKANNYSYAINTKADVISFLAKDSEQIKQLEKEAKLLRVKANYGDNIFLAKLVNEALKDVKAACYKLPKKIIYATGDYKGHNAFTRGANIYLNPDYNWQGLASMTKRNYSAGYTSTDNPKHNIYHEIGHAIHQRCHPIKFLNLVLSGTRFSPDEQVYISTQVSIYAAKTVFEFVAEVFAGQMAGKKYPEDIMKYYYELGGPESKTR